jgi:hypothetical protein
MKIRKEELAAFALVTLSVVLLSFGYDNIVVDGLQSERKSPVTALIMGLILMSFLAHSARQQHFGDAARNGRVERPVVFWQMAFAMFVLGTGLIVLSVVQMARST